MVKIPNHGIYGARKWFNLTGQTYLGAADALRPIGVLDEDDTITINAIPTFTEAPTFTMGDGETFTITATDASGGAVAPFVYTSNMPIAGATGGRALFTLLPTAKLGGWANAIKGYTDFSTTYSSSGSIGLVSAICAEIRMPKGACAGAFYPMEIEWVGQVGTAFGIPGSGSQSGFIYLAASGTVTDLNADGVFMRVNGLSAGATALLSTNSQTLKCTIGTSTTRYLLLSQATDSLSLDSCATAITLGDNVTTIGIQIGDVPTGILLDGDFTTAIDINAEADLTDAITINAEAGFTIGTGINMTGETTGTFTTGISMTFTNSATEGISISMVTAEVLATGMSMSGAGAYTAGILLDATGIMTDGILISSTTPVDGIHISSACSANAINLSGAYTGNGITFSGAITANGIEFTNGGSAAIGILMASDPISDTGIEISATCANFAIDISGTQSDVGLGISGACVTAINIAAPTTTGIRMAGDAAYNPIHIGTKANDATGGLNMSGQDSYDNQGGIMLFCDDGGTTLAATYTTSAIWTRYLITQTQSSNTATGAYLQMKSLAATFTACDYSAAKVYFETAGAIILSTGNVSVLNVSFEMDGAFTDTAEGLTGINLDVNDGGDALDITKASTGIRIKKTSGSTAGWPIGLYIEDTGATTGINIGNCTTGILLDGTFTTGISMVGGVSYNPIHIGTKSNSASDGLVLTGVQDDMGGIMVFCDDGGVDLTDSWTTSPIWTRYAITTDQTSNTATGAYLQLKMVGARTLTSSDYSAIKAYVECSGTVALTTADITPINVTLELGGNITNTSGSVAGINIDINTGGSHSIIDTAKDSAGIIIRKTSGSTAGWPVGLKIDEAIKGIGILYDSGAVASASGLLMGGGTTANPNTSTVASDFFIEWRCKSTASSGDNRLMYLRYDAGGSGTWAGECLRAFTKVTGAVANVTGGSFACIFDDSSGAITGSASGLSASLNLNTGGQTDGHLYGADISIWNDGVHTGALPNTHAILAIRATGDTTGAAQVLHALAFQNVAGEGTGEMIYDHTGDDTTDPEGTIRILVDEGSGYVSRYLRYWDSE